MANSLAGRVASYDLAALFMLSASLVMDFYGAVVVFAYVADCGPLRAGPSPTTTQEGVFR